MALLDFNVAPPVFSPFTFKSLPEQYYSCVANGLAIYALVGLQVLEAGKHFSYSDHGITLARDRSGKYQAAANALITMYVQQREKIKKIYGFERIGPHGLFSSTSGFPINLTRVLRGVRKWG